MLLIWFSENIVNYMTFGTWLNYVNMDLVHFAHRPPR